MNRRTNNKIFKRSQKKLDDDRSLTTLEDSVWKDRNEHFLRVAVPIINKLFDEEIKEGTLMERVGS